LASSRPRPTAACRQSSGSSAEKIDLQAQLRTGVLEQLALIERIDKGENGSLSVSWT